MFEKFIKREGLIIAAGTMMLYASVYFFERGFCARLNIPLEFIDITIPTACSDLMAFYLFIFPVVITSVALMIYAEKNRNKGLHALAPLWCGLVYAIVLFLYLEKKFSDAVISLFMGLIFFSLIIYKNNYRENDSALQSAKETIITIAMAIFLISFTFSALGRSHADTRSFPSGEFNGKQYAILKIYGENIFMQEIKDGKRVSGVMYANAQNMTGMMLKSGR